MDSHPDRDDVDGVMSASGDLSTPRVFDSEFASLFRLRKADLVVSTGEPSRCQVRQTGSAYEDTAAHVAGDELALEWPTGWSPTEPLIETFVVDTTSGSWTPMGDNDHLNAAWAPAVERFAHRMLALIAAHDIPVAGEAFLTTSLTPAPIVTNTPHFDDDQFVPTDGVGLVAILGQLGGPLVARGALDRPALASPDEVRLDEDTLQRFSRRDAPLEQADAERIVVFPQFGQLHSGPTLTGRSDGEVRGLLVFRVATTPDAADAVQPPSRRRGRSGRRAR